MARTVEFHTGVTDLAQFACRLLRKAFQRGATVLCVAPRGTLEALDRALWTFAEREFVPHIRLETAPGRLRARTPVWLAESVPPEGPARDVVLNLGVPLALAAVGEARLIELVAEAPEDVAAGRERWRQYKAAGFEVIHHPPGTSREG
ncbi:MAG: DNA polymerase III subunit chi [Rubrivivax sp.]|nr:DNA polymerase III subunit chi [Rubrivivax sp.]